MFSLILAGESIFTLPFHVSRYFRPTMLDVFAINNTQLGFMGSVYGVVAMVSYLLGGGLADRFSARSLIGFALIATGACGFYMATIPGYAGMLTLFALWGATTILPFWAALIRATRQLGGSSQQGRAFGILDGGRGLLAAVMASVIVVLFDWFLPSDEATLTMEQRRSALQAVIVAYTVVCISAAFAVWCFVVGNEASENAEQETAVGEDRHETWDDRFNSGWSRLSYVARLPSVWLQSLIIVCAYSAYRGTDFFSLYAKDAYGLSEVDAAGVSALSTWMRPIACIGAGYLADRIRSSTTVICACFLGLVVAFASFAYSDPEGHGTVQLWVHVIAVSALVFALRGVYFALFEEVRLPVAVTGTAVGVISFVGYTPEIFMPPLAGHLVDRYPGAATGHHDLYTLLAAICGLGAAAALVLQRLRKP